MSDGIDQRLSSQLSITVSFQVLARCAQLARNTCALASHLHHIYSCTG